MFVVLDAKYFEYLSPMLPVSATSIIRFIVNKIETSNK